MERPRGPIGGTLDPMSELTPYLAVGDARAAIVEDQFPRAGFEPGTGVIPARAFCAVTAVMLKVRRCEAGRLAGQVAYVTFTPDPMLLFGSAAKLCAGAVGS